MASNGYSYDMYAKWVFEEELKTLDYNKKIEEVGHTNLEILKRYFESRIKEIDNLYNE